MQGQSSAKVFDTIAYLRLYAVFIFVHRAHCIAFLAIRNITLMPTTLHHAQYITLNSHYAASDHITSQCSCSTSSYITLHLLYEISLMFSLQGITFTGTLAFAISLYVYMYIALPSYVTLHCISLRCLALHRNAAHFNTICFVFRFLTLRCHLMARQGRAGHSCIYVRNCS